MKTTFQLAQSRIVGEESLEPHQVVQEAGGEVGGGDLRGQLWHHQERPPACHLSALDNVGIEMVSTVQDLTLNPLSHQVGQLASRPSTENSSCWDLRGLNSRTECAGGHVNQVERGPS